MILLDVRRWLANCAHRFARIAGLKGSVSVLRFAVGEARASGWPLAGAHVRRALCARKSARNLK